VIAGGISGSCPQVSPASAVATAGSAIVESGWQPGVRGSARRTGAGLVLLMVFAAMVSVIQLAVVTSWARSVRVVTLLQAISVGFLVVAPLTIGLQWLITRAVAWIGPWRLAEVVDVLGWAADPALEEILKVAPLIIVAWLWPRTSGQLGLVDHLLVGAATGAGFALAEGVLRYGQLDAMAIAVPGGYLAGATLSGAIGVPSIWASLTTWLPVPVSYDWPAMSGAQHLVWSALAAAGLGWFIRRGSHRWLGLIPLVLVSLTHANYNAAHSLSGMAWSSPALSWIEQRLAGLLLVVLVVLVLVDRVGLAGARRSRPELLLDGERSDGLGPWPLAKVAVRGAPWSSFVAWRVVLERRASLNAQLAGVPPPEFADEVEQRITQVQQSADRARWAGAAKQVAGALSLRGLRSWRTLLWVLSVVPALLFLVVGGWPATRGLQELAGTWFGAGLMLVGLAIGWVLLATQLPALVRQLRQQSEPSLHEQRIRPAFQLATGVASLVTAALVVAALVVGGDPTQRLVTNYHILDALSSAELWLGRAIILLAFLLFPPAAALVVTTAGTVLLTSSGVALAVGSVVGATLVSHALLNAASGSGTSGGGGGASSGSGSGTASSGEVRDVLRNLPQGRSQGVRVVGSGEELVDLYKRLIRGGKPIEVPSYKGKWSELPDGTRIGLRDFSKSGHKTIDIKFPGGETGKVHVDG